MFESSQKNLFCFRFFLFPAETIPDDESESRSVVTHSSSSSLGSAAASSVGGQPVRGRAVFQSLPFGKAPQLLAGKRYEREPPKKSLNKNFINLFFVPTLIFDSF